jgi:transposase
MGNNFVSRDADQAFLMPQDVREWLPEGHLCWRVLDAVGELDLSAFSEAYRSDGQGRPPYDPAMMTALLLYCRSKGIRSSRAVEAACWDDVGCRVITANRRVDHSTVARFTTRHRAALNGLFPQVLAMCVREGLVDPAAVAVDGSVVDGNASRDSNRSLGTIDDAIAHAGAAVDALLEEVAACAERAEREPGWQPPTPARGASSPARLSRLAARLLRARAARAALLRRELPPPSEREEKAAAARRMVERARSALAEAVAAHQEVLDDYARRAAAGRAEGRRGAVGRPPAPMDGKAAVARQRDRLARAQAALEQALNPRPVASRSSRASLTDPDSRLLLGKHGGYVQGYNLQLAAARGQLLTAVELHDSPSDCTALAPVIAKARAQCALAGLAQDILLWLADNGYASTANFEALAGLPLLVAVTGGAPGAAQPGEERCKPVPAGWAGMAERLATPEGKDQYKQRAALVEPAFAQLFQRFGRHVLQRGADLVAAELKFMGTVHNLGKLFTSRAARAAHPAPV